MTYRLKNNQNNLIGLLLFSLSTLLIGACNRPTSKFIFEPTASTAPAKIRFQNQSEKAESYLWKFGDGEESTMISPDHKYTRSGEYEVELIARLGKKTSRSTQKLSIDAPEKCLVELQTDSGSMTIWLYDATPKHRDNFLKLAEEGYYDGLLFHRVIQGFMIQGGDPNSRNAPAGQALGSGGPGYTIEAEFVDTLAHFKGVLAAARTGDQVNPEKRSSGSQFYIVQGKSVSSRELDIIEAKLNHRYTPEQRERYTKRGGTPFLDKNYTVFGEVIDGLEIIDLLAKVKTDGGNRPLNDLKMTIRIVE